METLVDPSKVSQQLWRPTNRREKRDRSDPVPEIGVPQVVTATHVTMITESETTEAIGTEATTDLVATVIVVHLNQAANPVRNHTTGTQDITET